MKSKHSPQSFILLDFTFVVTFFTSEGFLIPRTTCGSFIEIEADGRG